MLTIWRQVSERERAQLSALGFTEAEIQRLAFLLWRLRQSRK